MKDLERIAKAAVIVLFGIVFGKLTGYVIRLVVSRNGAEQYGLFALGYAIFSILVFVAMLGLAGGITRYVAYYRAQQNSTKMKEAISTAIKLVLPASVCIAFLVFVFSEQISLVFFHNAGLIPILRIFSFGIPFMALAGLFSAILVAFQRIKYAVYAKDIFYGIVVMIALFLLFIFGYRQYGAPVAIVLASITCLFLSIYYFFKIFSLKNLKFKLHRELWSFSWPILLSGILWWILLWTDSLMIGHFLGAKQVGIYNVASPTSHLMGIAPTALLTLFLPVSTALYARKKNYSEIFKTVSKWIFAINLPILLLMVFFPKQIITLTFGKEYIAGSIALSILAIGFFLYFLFMANRQVFAMLKKTRLIFFLDLVVVFLNVLLNYLFIPRFGIEGGAVATSCSILISISLLWAFSPKAIKTREIRWAYLKAGLIGFISIILVYVASLLFLVGKTPLYYLIFMFLVFILLYFALLFAFGVIDKQDIRILKLLLYRQKQEGYFREL